LRDQKPAADQGTDEGRSDIMESSLKAGLKLYPPVPPPALFEVAELIEAATAFWGLEEGALIGTSKKPEICWPRFVCCWLLKQKGLSNTAIGKVLGEREHNTIANGIKQFKALSEVYPAYKEQAKAFDRYCWNSFKGLPTKRYKTGVARS
jgi:chromosomal replication initiation ATPase DnaA